ncbi:hypothetical protein NE237_014044 [Protea cynaroides]|uniref:Methyltransferase n=1 Tax=Protea cynaroides TaxID=273540 RepID=A0A9Q0GZS7_9MAGN|nr:hypothetical protein NE237_014044 [Protea cynaroides]
MQLQEIQDNIRSGRNKIFLLMEEVRRLRVRQCIKNSKIIDDSSEEAYEMPEIPSSIPFLPHVTPKTLQQLYLTSFSFISGIIIFGGLLAPTEDNRLWKKHVNSYKRINQLIGTGRYRNMMDMNAGLGGFAAALESPKSWVMNVVPTIVDKNTWGVIYERGLIRIYHDWCEAFSTYPRAYNLIHASGIFSLYQNKYGCQNLIFSVSWASILTLIPALSCL